MTSRDLQIAVLKAQDLQDWQQHIAWEEVLGPALAQTKRLLTERLVALSLGAKPDGDETVEKIAGKLFGLDWIEKEIARVYRQGREAERILSHTPQ